MKRTTILTFLFALVAMTGWGQEKKDSIYLTGSVADSFTKAAIPDVFVTLMSQDSTVIDTTHVYRTSGYTWGIGRGQEMTGYYFSIDRKPAELILRFEHPNYETTYLPVSVKNPGKRRQYIEGPKAYLKKSANAHHHEGGELDEVVVKATKIKMVWKGDTLVYNADAFNVPEGSMLDGLIKQLPGVELKDNGEIFVNGKKIDNLTLNGADFFKGKNKMMLDNLPYFTVKNIEVYKKQTPENKFLGINDEDKKEYTMDVILKREYNVGGSANIEAGYGTDDRYKVKGFGIRFTERTRAVLFGGLNNINETMDYDGNSSSYNDRTNQSGNRHFRQVGGQFIYQAPEDKFTNTTDISAQWSDNKSENRTQSETYMSDASTFGKSQSHSRSQPSRVEINNTMRLTYKQKYHLYNDLNLTYERSRYEGEGWNLTTADAMMNDSINSSWYRSRSQSDILRGRGYAYFTRRMATGDNISLTVNGNFTRQYRPDSWSLNHYDYYRLGTTDHRDRQTHSPSHNYQCAADLSYRYQLTKYLNITPSIGIGIGNNRSDRHEYLRDSIDYLFDLQNSYEQSTRSLDRRTGLNIDFNREINKDWYMGLYSSVRFNFQRQHMSYDSEPLTTSLTKHYTLFSPNAYLYLSRKDDKKSLNAQYYFYPSTPGITDLIDRPITSDPLNIYIGNPDLKMTQQHNWNMQYTVRRDTIDQTIRLTTNGYVTHNERVQGYAYDMLTGVRTYRPENISSGNWQIGTSINWDRALDKKKFFHIGNELSLRYTKSTGYAFTASSTTEELSKVGNFFVHYRPNIRYQKDKLTIQLKGEVNYRHIHRNITVGNQPTDIWDFNYGLNGSYKMPWDMTIDTDISVHSHRGYADAEMNDNRVYWDAALTKSLKQGRWIMKLRAYDLLGQVSNIRYSISAQGRTETWNNALRRYAMLTVSYRFTQKPKKK